MARSKRDGKHSGSHAAPSSYTHRQQTPIRQQDTSRNGASGNSQIPVCPVRQQDTAQYSRQGNYQKGNRGGNYQGNYQNGYQGNHVTNRIVSSSELNQYQRDAYMQKRSQTKRGKWRVVLIVSIVVLIASLAGLGAIVYQYLSQQGAYNDLEQYATVSEGENLALSDLTVDWDALRAINPDIVAWVYVPNSPINYPVVQGNNNEEYLHKAFDGSEGWLASAGTIFLDSSNTSDFSDRNSALYGHHMNDGSMFAALSDWQNSDEFNAHRDIYVLTPQGNYRLKSFALVKTTGTDALVQTAFSSEENYQSYIQDKLDRSVVTQTGDMLSAADIQQSMMFATCEYSQADGRAVLFAAVVETTVSNDLYLSAVEEGSTGISAGQSSEMGSKYKEAA